MNGNKSILSIHIDDDCLNIVALRQTANGLQVDNWAAKPLGEGIIKDGLIVDEKGVSQKIHNFVKTNRLKPCKVVMQLPCSAVRLKPSEFPAQTDEQLKMKVEEQIGMYFLFKGQEIIFDYCVFRGTAQSSNKQTVLQAVTNRQVSDVCLAVVRKAGLHLERIEPAVLPILKLVYGKQAENPETVSLLLALESSSANVSVFKNDQPQLCQNMSIGTNDLLQGEDGFARLKEHIKPVLEFAHSIADSQQLGLKIVAACNAKKLETITKQIKQSLSDVVVEQIDCTDISREFKLQGIDEGDVPIFPFASALTSLGLFESQELLNLVSQESLIVQRTRKEMSLTAKAVAAVVLLSITALVPLKMKIKGVEAVSSEIEAKVAETIPIKNTITDLKKQMRQLKEKYSAYDAVGKELIDIPWPKALQAIGDTVPDKVRIVDISTTDSGNFTLFGEALAEKSVYKFIKELQNDEIIESAKVEKIEYDDSSDQILVDYKITCKIRMPESDL
ncbi:MAG: pilus assembly protein PilM [Planctomycetota bacterium]